MAKVSRFNKKQPAFDPSELTDLIFSPAVGTGVGSHLVGVVDNVATVAICEMTTVVDNNMATVDETTTVVNIDMPTVDMSPRSINFWITEQGSLVPEGRVKQIRLAQDVVSAAEESVYDALWTAGSVQTDSRDLSRVVQAGYDYLVKQTQLSKRTIQRLIEKLIDKDFIAIERHADIYQRSSTVYRVFSYKTVLDRHVQKGRSHVAKLGAGHSYVRPLSETSPQ